jgi:hypothetical protein
MEMTACSTLASFSFPSEDCTISTNSHPPNPAVLPSLNSSSLTPTKPCRDTSATTIAASPQSPHPCRSNKHPIPKPDERPPIPTRPTPYSLTPPVRPYTAHKRQPRSVARYLVRRTSRKWRKCKYPHPCTSIWLLRGAHCPPSRTRHIRGISHVFGVGLDLGSSSTGGFLFATAGRGRCSGRRPWIFVLVEEGLVCVC